MNDVSSTPARSWLKNALIGGGLALAGTLAAWAILWKFIR